MLLQNPQPMRLDSTTQRMILSVSRERPWNYRLRLGKSKTGVPVINSQHYHNRMAFVPAADGDFYLYAYPDGLDSWQTKVPAGAVWMFVQQVRLDKTSDILDVWETVARQYLSSLCG